MIQIIPTVEKANVCIHELNGLNQQPRGLKSIDLHQSFASIPSLPPRCNVDKDTQAKETQNHKNKNKYSS